MVPALTALQKTAAKPITRFGVMYVPNGMVMKQWTPAAEGAGFELTPTLAPLAPFRDDLLVLSNLACVPDAGTPGRRACEGEHALPHRRLAADERDLARRRHLDGSDRSPERWARTRSSASLELAIESGETAGRVRRRLRVRLHQHDLVAGRRTRRCRRENNPRVVFERLFGDSGSTDPRARLARIRQDRSVLDSVREEVAHLQGALGAGRSRRSWSSISRRFATSSGASRRPRSRATRSCRVVDHPAGIPATYDEHVRLMCDLQVLAYQTDLTRVVTFMLGPRVQRRDLSADRRARRASPDLAPPAGAGEDREGGEDQRLPRHAVRLSAGEAAVDARRRRLAARSRDDDVRRRHGRLQRARPAQHPARAGRRRRRSSRADVTSAIRRRRRSRTCT